MTNEPNPDGSSSSSNRHSNRRTWRQLRRIGIPLGIVTLAGVAGGAWWGWVFVNEKLAPLVETNLSQALNRPVQLGKVERVTLTSLRFGPSSVPATATDSDRLSIQRIDIAFNPWQILLTRNLNLDITALKPEIYIEQTPDGTWVSTQIAEQERKGPIKTDIQAIRFKDAIAILVPTGKFGGKATPVKLSSLNGAAKFLDQNQRITYELAGRSATAGTLNLTGETLRTSQQTNLQVRGQNFLVSEIDRLVKLPVDLQAGRGSGNVSVQLRPDAKVPYLVGNAQFQGVTLKVPRVPQRFAQSTGSLQLQGTRIRLENVNTLFGKVPVQANGDVDTQAGFNLAAKVKPVSLPTVVETLALKLPFPVAGEVVADLKVTGPTQKPVITGTARNTKLSRLDKVDLSRFNAQFRLDTGTQRLTIAQIQATPTAGGSVTGNGLVNLSTPPTLALNFNVANVPGDPIARVYNGGNTLPITVGQVNAQAQITGPANNVQTLVRWQAPEATYTGRGEILIAGGITTLRNTVLNVAGGTATVQARAEAGRWQARVAGAQIQLNRFSRDLRGLFSGNLALSGSLASFKPATVRAQGNVRFSQGISVVGQPLTAQVQWDGQKILVQQATAPGVSANGAIYARLEGPGAPAITNLALNVRTSNYSLQALNLPLPTTVDYSGRADFTGRLTGTPTAPNVTGGLTLRQFVLNRLAFEPVLRGNLRVNRGVSLNLAGLQDRIAVTLDSAYQPVAFDIRRGDAIATGRTQGELLLVQAQNFPLSILPLPAGTTLLGGLSGQLNGNVAVNLRRRSVNGELTIARPALGGYRADQFGGRISFANGVATLTRAELRRGESIFQLNGSANVFSPNSQVKGQLKVVQGRLQDVLGLLQVFDLSDIAQLGRSPDYGNKDDLRTSSVELSNATLLNQLRRLSEVKTLLAQIHAQRDAAPLPELSELTGQFAGEINVAGSLQTGINANFDLRGQDWQWGPYSAKQVVAVGNFENGTLSLLPLRFQSDQSLIAFTGQIGGAQQSGQFRMENVPIERLTGLVDLPVDVQGNLNATATLSGTLDNPQAVGLIQLNNGVLNGTDVSEAQGSFRYADARLGFDSRVTLTGTEPLTLSGSVPYQLPFASVAPDNDQISLDINVKNEGLSLLNALTRQVAWVDGKGQVNVKVGGTLQQPIATGTAQVEGATLTARALPEPVTDVTGTIRFDRDRLRVETLQGNFSRGNIVAKGVIPIAGRLSDADSDAANPLAVDLNQININLKGLYQGGVSGNVQVIGSALNPAIGGTIRLNNGQVLLSTVGGTQAGTGSGGGSQSAAGDVAFQNLRIELGNAVRVTSAPLLNFVAFGDLNINGSINDIRPSGTIRLRSGQVNLFTTQFVLERGYPQTARFSENNGLDPELNVRLTALVSEVTGSRLPASPISSEINDALDLYRFGSLQSVRVQAQVRGLASQLSENLELTSSPARSTAEIVSLIGGGFTNTLGQGSGALGLANIAGSAVLTNIQGFIGNALGLSEFRLFPTISPNTDSRNSRSNSNLDLAAEAGVDITRRLSVSVLKVLTSDQPAQFGLRYRLNQRVIVRTSTDFSGDNRAVVEYESRF